MIQPPAVAKILDEALERSQMITPLVAVRSQWWTVLPVTSERTTHGDLQQDGEGRNFDVAPPYYPEPVYLVHGESEAPENRHENLLP